MVALNVDAIGVLSNTCKKISMSVHTPGLRMWSTDTSVGKAKEVFKVEESNNV